jgi:hypothetical protein
MSASFNAQHIRFLQRKERPAQLDVLLPDFVLPEDAVALAEPPNSMAGQSVNI